MQFSKNIGVGQNESRGSKNLCNSILSKTQKFIIFTIYQNYILALSTHTPAKNL